ncbi:unnamed protein product [marine sediment metagenome]|uniref:N-acetyltransferase domain-containing protein n=1 Tax=marine sediment metagenome TaxID=412755 RepID=X0XYQ6_9ZZZZ
MNNIIIRRAVKSDIPAVSKLATELIDSVKNGEGIAKNVLSENSQNVLANPSSYILLAETEEKVIGFINFMTRKTIIHSGLCGLIDELVVSKRYRRKGVGKELINAAVEKCRKLKCCEVELSTEFTNVNARAFYKHCGFEDTGVIFEKHLH